MRPNHSHASDDAALSEKEKVAPSLLSQPNAYAEQQWNRASNMLQTNPTLVTHHILCMALKHRPPLHAIQLMLHLNSKAASIPKTGPTALQIAVQNTCSLEVITLLIQACPFALVATNPGSHLDPLSYAKRFRSSEHELIKLLSLPFSHWMSPTNDVGTSAGSTTSSTINQSKRSHQSVDTAKSPYSYKSDAAVTSSASPTQTRGSTSTPTGLNSNYHMNPNRAILSLADRQELNNVKTLCATVVKGHRRLTREMGVCKDQMASLPAVTTIASQQHQDPVVEQRNASLLKDMERQQQKHFRVQLIALDMKEQAMRAQVQRMERRIVKTVLENSQQRTYYQDGYETVVGALRAQVEQFQRRLEQAECHFEPRALYQPPRIRRLPGTRQGKSSDSSTHVTAHRRRGMHQDKHASGNVNAPVSTSFVFATPVVERIQPPDDDSLSLLTEDCIAHRHYKPWWPGRMGRRCWLIVMQH